MQLRGKVGRRCLLVALVFLFGQAWGQIHMTGNRSLASHIIVPQARSFRLDRGTPVQVTEVNVGVVVLEQAPITTMDISLTNPTARRIEAELAVSAPNGAVVRSFTFHGAATEPKAEIPRKRKEELL